MIRRIFATAVSLYVFILALLALLNITLVDPPAWVALPNIFTALWFLPLVLLIPLAFLISSLQLRIATLSLYALFVVLFGSWLLPRLAPSDAAGPSLALTTLNQLVSNEDADAVLDALRAHEADVVALQELSPAVAEALSRLEGYPYRALEPKDTAEGLGLLSRYPLGDITYTLENGFSRQQAILSVGERDVTLFNVHLPTPFGDAAELEGLPFATLLSYNSSVRNDNLVNLLELALEAPTPLVILGDFNLSDFEAAYGGFAEGFKNVYRVAEAGFGFTFPENRQLPPFPFIRIDHIWVSEEVTPLRAGVDCRETGSDHCLLWGEVALP